MFILLAVLFAIAVVGVKAVGLDVYMVLSPSMEPSVPVGSIIWIKDINDPSTLKEGDVITFELTKRTTATHRIVRIEQSDTDPAGYVFITKGDNNDGEDNVPVSPSSVVGKSVVTIPYLGYVANYIQNKPGNYVAIGVCISFIILLFIIDLLSDDDKVKNKKSKKKANEACTEASEPIQVEEPSDSSAVLPDSQDDGKDQRKEK